MWRFKETDENAVRLISEQLAVPVPLVRVLVARGYRDAGSVRRFLSPRIGDLLPASAMPDMAQAIELIAQAVHEHTPILVWGHEDLDGMTAAVCLRETIRDLRGVSGHYIPPKGSTPHGLSPDKAREFFSQGYRLIVTVDCGVTNFTEVEQIQALGMNVVITDHHEVLGRLPPARAIVNPKRTDSEYSFAGLAGVGVALQTAFELVHRTVGLGVEAFFSSKPELLTMAAMGTIADRVVLTRDNRVLVRFGLDHMRQTRLPAVLAVMEAGGIRPEDMTVSRFVLDLLPLFSSTVGNTGVDMLLSTDAAAARAWARELVNQYQVWRDEARNNMQIAERYLDLAPGILFVRSDELSLRALGHCASKLKEQYLVPAVIMGRRGENWVGECRGVDGVNLVDLLRANARYLLDFGGHAKACGFTVPDSRSDAFISSAKDYAARNFLGRIAETREPIADAIVSLSEITDDFRRLAPLGEGNPEPLLVSLNTTLLRKGSEVTCAGAPHLRLLEATDVLPGHYDVLYTLDDSLNVRLKQLEPVGASLFRH